MSEAFYITLLATTGDPQGIRHIEKSNWSGIGVVFPKSLFKELKSEIGFNQAGVYILVGSAAQETLYIGEADPVGDRLKRHVAIREDWDWGVYFFDQNNKIGKTEIQYLEAELVRIVKEVNRAVLTNKQIPTRPSMSLTSKAMASVFLTNMLQILPMLGITAFTPLDKGEIPDDEVLSVGQAKPSDVSFDTVVVPAREEGFRKRFLGENCWFAIRMSEANMKKIKYIAAYQVAPVGAITHIAEVERIVPYEDTGKYIVYFKAAAEKISPIPRIETTTVNMQSPRYALRKNILKAKHIDDVWKS